MASIEMEVKVPFFGEMSLRPARWFLGKRGGIVRR